MSEDHDFRIRPGKARRSKAGARNTRGLVAEVLRVAALHGGAKRGLSIILERQLAADAAGFAGLQDRVDQRRGNLLRAAAVSTLLGVGAELGADGEDDLVRALRRGPQSTINQAGQRIVDRQLNVQPTLTIRPGHPLRVILTRDLILEPVGGNR